MARYRRFLNSLQQSFIALFKAIAGLFVKAARQTFIHKRHRRQSARFPRFRQAGFVLPTTALILVVLGLVVAALLIRTSTRMEEVIVARQTQEIENAASPAIDRARAKIESLFDRNDFSTPPTEAELDAALNNNGNQGTIQLNANPFNLPNEVRLDLDGNGVADNAWVYNKGNTTIAYSIILETPQPGGPRPLGNLAQQAARATNLEVRNEPIFDNINPRCEVPNAGNLVAGSGGWFQPPNNQALLTKLMLLRSTTNNKVRLLKERLLP